jgi:hypothetical protein
VVVELGGGRSESGKSDQGVEVWRPKGEREIMRRFDVEVWRPEGEIVRWFDVEVW